MGHSWTFNYRSTYRLWGSVVVKQLMFSYNRPKNNLKVMLNCCFLWFHSSQVNKKGHDALGIKNRHNSTLKNHSTYCFVYDFWKLNFNASFFVLLSLCYKVLSLLEACFDLISVITLPSMKIRIMGGKITENLGFESPLRKVKRFFVLFLFIFKFFIKNCISLCLTIFWYLVLQIRYQ